MRWRSAARLVDEDAREIWEMSLSSKVFVAVPVNAGGVVIKTKLTDLRHRLR
jgi:hypothetical protein